MAASWLSADPAVAFTERLVLWYSPVWMAAVAAVVALGLFNAFTAATYVLFGAWSAAHAITCVNI